MEFSYRRSCYLLLNSNVTERGGKNEKEWQLSAATLAYIPGKELNIHKTLMDMEEVLVITSGIIKWFAIWRVPSPAEELYKKIEFYP